MSTSMRVFIIECPNPIDLLQGRNEQQVLEQVCRLAGHEVTSFLPKSKKDLASVCRYISSIDREHDGSDNPDLPLCIHISSHGEESGLYFGEDLVSWNKLLKALQPVLTDKSIYQGDKILALSACEAKEQLLTAKIEKKWQKDKKFQPPRHLFVTADEDVYWRDTVVAWALFYNKIPKFNLSKKKKTVALLTLIRNAELGCFHYYRWSDKKGKYQCFCPEGRLT